MFISYYGMHVVLDPSGYSQRGNKCFQVEFDQDKFVFSIICQVLQSSLGMLSIES